MEIEKKQGSICTLQRKHLCTHVTALKTYKKFLFIAESNQVLLFNWKEKALLEKEIVFESCSIHGIRIDTKGNVVFFGAKSLRIFTFTTSSSKRLTKLSAELYFPDWIHDVQWLTEEQKPQNSFAIVSAHNCLTIFDYESGKNNIVQCTENCILYAGSIIISDVNVIIVAAGTVFQKILLWSPHSSKEIDGRKLPFQSLSGHQGVIFSVIYSKTHKLLSSTSDDRSIRLWKVHNSTAITEDSLEFWENANITIAHVLFAHESRVWMSAVLEDCILSVGEDSNLCYWDLQGNLLKKRKCHKNGSVWCLEVAKFACINKDTSEQENYIAFTGGSDGGVYGWDVESAFSSRFISQISLPTKESSSVIDFPRITCLLTNPSSHIMVTTDKGCLVLYDTDFKNWKNIFYDCSFSSYCVPSVSYNSTYMALGNILGELVLIDLKDELSEEKKTMKFKIHPTKICSIHWVTQSNDYLLTCGIKGNMILWKVIYSKGQFHIQCIQELNLPKCKHHWWSTAALYINSKSCVVGDRGGSISVYSIRSTPNPQLENNGIDPCMTYRYIHGENGVTDIQEHNSLIYSAGRDGKVQLYTFSEKPSAIYLLHTIKVCHDLEWIGRIIFHEEDLLLLGFHTKHFMVWSTLLESAVMTVECGGGHRSWDFSLSEEGQATFAAIKKKDVIFHQENLHHVLKHSVLKGGISGQEFCHTTYLFTKTSGSTNSMSIVACGGEDNGLRIIGFHNETNSQIVSICNLSGHLSSIRAISKVKIVEENAYLVVSVGGRSQMVIWKIQDDPGIKVVQLRSYILSDLEKETKKQSKKEQDVQIDPQTRLMDVSICYSETNYSIKGKYIISTACSDSYFRIYLFDEKRKDLNLYYNFHHGENCILKLSQILLKHPTDDILFVTGATDGRIKVFSYETCKAAHSEAIQSYTSSQQIEPSICTQLHQSGINALDVKHVKGPIWLICSAGDDNALAVALVNITHQMEKLKMAILCKNHVPNAHASQIVGVKIFEENSIVTASIDQRINIWKWNFSNNFLAVNLILSKMTLIPDIAHLDAWQNELSKSWTLLVCGQGMESFDLNFQNT